MVDVPKKANAFGGKIRRKPNPKGTQASTRVILNAPPVRFPSVASPPPRRRPSWHVWVCPSLTETRPSAARQKSVAGPWRVRRARTPHEPTQDERHTNQHKTNATQDATERRTNAERTMDEHTRNQTSGSNMSIMLPFTSISWRYGLICRQSIKGLVECY